MPNNSTAPNSQQATNDTASHDAPASSAGPNNQPATDPDKLRSIADSAHEVLFSTQSVFPFMLFPDSITVDRIKVTVVQRAFFRVSEVNSFQIEDILNVEGDTGPFFGSLKIYTRFFSTEPLRINYLSRKDTIFIKRILQGYNIARQRKIECMHIPRDELVALLYDLGGESSNNEVIEN